MHSACWHRQPHTVTRQHAPHMSKPNRTTLRGSWCARARDHLSAPSHPSPHPAAISQTRQHPLLLPRVPISASRSTRGEGSDENGCEQLEDDV
eukprot:2334869-Rhodomonas_salina.1